MAHDPRGVLSIRLHQGFGKEALDDGRPPVRGKRPYESPDGFVFFSRVQKNLPGLAGLPEDVPGEGASSMSPGVRN